MPALTLRKSLHRFLNTTWLHDYRLYALWVFMPFGYLFGYLCPLGIYALWVFMPFGYLCPLGAIGRGVSELLAPQILEILHMCKMRISENRLELLQIIMLLNDNVVISTQGYRLP